MKIAFERLDISPALPVRLSGFGAVRWAQKIHDPIYARLFLFNNGKEEILWIQLDLTCINEYLVDLVQKATGINSKNLILSCTHTHSGPCGTARNDVGILNGMESVFGEVNASYCEKITNQIASAVASMRDTLRPFKYRLLKGKISDLGTDRHDASLPCDDDLLVMEFITEEKKALLVKLACHPTVLNGSNLEVSADFPGAIEPNFKDYALVAMVNGSCGDMSTRFTRKGSGFEEVERFGKLASDQIKQLLESDFTYHDDFSINTQQRFFTLKTKKSDTLEEAQAKVDEARIKLEKGKKDGLSSTEIRLLEAIWEGAINNLLASTMLSRYTELNLSVHAISLPNFTLATVPVELFSKLSNSVKVNRNLDFVGYTNGYFLYMPDENAYLNNFYEAGSSPFAPKEGERFIQEIIDWIDTL